MSFSDRIRNGGEGKEWRGIWCRGFEAGYSSCYQPVLKTFTGPHTFFNHQQTPEGRDAAPFYICSQLSVPKSSTIINCECYFCSITTHAYFCQKTVIQE